MIRSIRIIVIIISDRFCRGQKRARSVLYDTIITVSSVRKTTWTWSPYNTPNNDTGARRRRIRVGKTHGADRSLRNSSSRLQYTKIVLHMYTSTNLTRVNIYVYICICGQDMQSKY